MTPADLLTDAFGRIRAGAHRVLADVDDEALAARPGPDANTIGWLVWHLLRVQDDHIADVAGTEQVWTSQGYAARAGLPFDDGATGFGQSAEEVGQVRVGAGLLGEYADAVTTRPSPTWRPSVPTTSTASWTSPGTRPSRSPSGWSA